MVREAVMTNRFQDQVVVITGGARGIGFAAAKQFAKEGARVVINDLDPGAVETAVSQIKQEGGQALGVACDVSDHAQVRTSVERVMSETGRIDVLVNNAGIIGRAETVSLEPETWTRVLAVNLNGVFFWAQAVAAASMIPRRSGSIVNVASLAGLTGIPNGASYVASKHGVVGLTKALAVDWGPYNIRVNAVCPGITLTDMTAADRARNPAMYASETNGTRVQSIPLGHAATAEDQAHAILFLASAEAGSVHGLIMNVDGGNLALSSGHMPIRPVAD